MTRTEKIANEAREFSSHLPHQTAFYYGAQWADEHPANPWHNVKDRKPNDHEKIFFRKKDGSKYCGWFDEKMQSFLTITPDVTKWTINGVTHWMKVPDMPADILDK